MPGSPEVKGAILDSELLRPNEIPSVMLVGRTLPETWEASIALVDEFGANIPTEYDQPVDPESRDVGIWMEVADPMAEPRVHRSLPCGLDDLEIYVAEVLDGVSDWKVSKGGSYSYHDRMVNWPGIDGWVGVTEVSRKELEALNVDQINLMVAKLAEAPHTRRAQVVTWNPLRDPKDDEPPCLQRIWCRIVQSEGQGLLEMNVDFRSNDALKAAFMNMYALTELQKRIAGRVSSLTGREVGVGRYVHRADSYHLYGSYRRKGEIDRFLNRRKSTELSTRVWRSDDPIVREQFALGRQRLAERGSRER